MPTRVVALTGAPGAGKTEVGRRLVDRLPGPGVVVDLDHLAGISPFEVGDPFFDLVGGVLTAALPHYVAWGARTIVVTGVLLPGGILDRLGPLLEDPGLDWVLYGLRARPATLVSRIDGDVKPQDASGRRLWTYLDELVPNVPGVREVSTEGRSIDEVVDAIVGAETAAADPEHRLPSLPPMVEVSAADVLVVVAEALEAAGAPEPTARRVAQALVEAELDGYPSHGILRVEDYLDAVGAGHIVPDACPEIVDVGPCAVVVDGGRAFGPLVQDAVVTALGGMGPDGMCAVAVRDSGHLGCLGPIGRRAAAAGIVVLGFVNYCGHGQKVAPPGGREGRLATNPILFAAPAGGGCVVLDCSTSTVSEGSVRRARNRGDAAPAGALVDDQWRDVTDAAALYFASGPALLTPLGFRGASHKGFGLGIVVEVLAGILAGAGSVAAPGGAPGNGGLFLGLSPSLFEPGRRLNHEVAQLHDHLAGCPVAPGYPPVRLPGFRRPIERSTIQIGRAFWRSLGRSDSIDMAKGRNH